MASCECPEEEGQYVAVPGCQNVRCAGHLPGPWVPVTLSKEGANSDAAAVIVEREEQHRENVGVKGAIVFCDKEGKHSGVIDCSAK